MAVLRRQLQIVVIIIIIIIIIIIMPLQTVFPFIILQSDTLQNVYKYASYITGNEFRCKVAILRAPNHVIQAITSEELAQGPHVAARGGIEPATFRTKGTGHHYPTYHASKIKI